MLLKGDNGEADEMTMPAVRCPPPLTVFFRAVSIALFVAACTGVGFLLDVPPPRPRQPPSVTERALGREWLLAGHQRCTWARRFCVEVDVACDPDAARSGRVAAP